MPNASRAAKPAASKSRNNKLDEVTNELANLKLQPRSTKQAPADAPTPSERLRNAMLAVNEASQSISAAVKSGWKLESATTTELEWSEAKVNKAMEPVGGALCTLRSIYQEQGNLAKIVDVERAALG
ncbi:hypothetical protein FS749_013486, partial [Ceratobasidium sp. UAMH 11750]